jgi:hypothetical protein
VHLRETSFFLHRHAFSTYILIYLRLALPTRATRLACIHNSASQLLRDTASEQVLACARFQAFITTPSAPSNTERALICK